MKKGTKTGQETIQFQLHWPWKYKCPINWGDEECWGSAGQHHTPLVKNPFSSFHLLTAPIYPAIKVSWPISWITSQIHLLRATTHQRAHTMNLQKFPPQAPEGSFYPKLLKTTSQGPSGQLLAKTIKNSFPRTFSLVLLPREHRDQDHNQSLCTSECPIYLKFQEKMLCL